MTATPAPRTLIAGGTVVTRDGTHQDHALVIAGDRIVAVERADTLDVQAGDVLLDARGAVVMPGMIDLHSDYVERMAAPRPTAVMDFRLALREAERELIGHGVTTMYHSLSMYALDAFASNPVRSVEHSRRLIEAIASMHEASHLIHHRFHARYEIDNVERVDELKGYLERGMVHLLSFMDHTPGQGQYRDLEVFRETVKGYSNLDDTQVDALIEKSQTRAKLTMEALEALSAFARHHGVPVASHDDDSSEKLDVAARFGTQISEFPVSLAVAHEARQRGLHTLAGAPNVLLGGSHSNNLSALEAVREGAIDILCSDYYPAALLHAVFQLHREAPLALHDAVALVTCNAADAAGIGHEVGDLAAGKRADVLIVDELADGMPVVRTAFASGVRAFEGRYRHSHHGAVA